MFTLDSTLRELLEQIPSYQPVSVGSFHKPGWCVQCTEQEEADYIRHLGLEGIDFQGKAFMDVGCAEGYACFYAEEQGAEYVICCDGHGWKYGTDAPNPWETTEPQNMMILFEIIRLLKGSRVVRLVEDVEAADFVDSVARLREGKIDIVLCAGVLYHTFNPVKALRNLFSVTGEMAIFNIPDFRELQADGRAFTPYPNTPEPNDFDYSTIMRYGHLNNRFWNLSPDDWSSMMEYTGFVGIETEAIGMCTLYRCRVP
jgi:SAM-dependent methyltransferase